MAIPAPAAAQAYPDPRGLESLFDSAFGVGPRAMPAPAPVYRTPLSQRVAELADGSGGRIGVAAVDLATGERVSVLGDQRFPMASTSKVAIAAAFLAGVESGRWSLNDQFPKLVPVPSQRFAGPVAPVREGSRLPAIDLIEAMIARSDNYATDALLRVVGGPRSVTSFARRAGIRDFSIDRDIATLVRDDGEFNPANHIDVRDSATPNAMVDMLVRLYQGQILGPEGRRVILGAMSRTVTGKRRIRALIPSVARVLHKTGSLSGTSSDIGFIETPDGRTLAIAIYVTGQGTRAAREAKIATIARALYDGYGSMGPRRAYASASRGMD